MSDETESLDLIRGVVGQSAQGRQPGPEDFPQNVQINGGLWEWIVSLNGGDLSVPWSAEDLKLYGTPQSIAQVQIGYSVDAQGKPLPDWHASWFVVGQLSGDPIIAMQGDSNCSVLFARHGSGKWSPQELASTPEQFVKSIKIWCDLFVVEFGKKIYNADFSIRTDFLARLGQGLGLILSESQRATFMRMVDE
ncbi:hypothetical protein [Burkholderia sp. LMG 21824]|uniref:hypothetical protein n=1 Tax=Burkholderia sp. LMG 21824 TaxID=3158172 RepID=UPI003C2B1326